MNYAANSFYPNSNSNGNHFNGNFDQNNANGSLDLPAFSVNPSNLDLGQFQNGQLQQQQQQQQQQRLRDGQMRTQTQSPSVQQQQGTYQVSPVVPAKRGRPSEDHGASPHPQQGNPAATRSQTPQQNPYPAAYSTQQGNTPMPAQHPGSAHPSPSPAMLQGPYRSQNMARPPQYNSNVNPGPNYQQADGMMNGMPGPMNMQGQPIHGGPPSQGGMMGHYSAPPYGPPRPMPMHPQMQEMQKQQYHMRLQQQAQQQQALRGAQGGFPQVNASLGQRATGQTGDRMMPPSAQASKGRQPTDDTIKSFASSLNSFMQSSGRQINPNPIIAGRPIQYYHLFQAAAKFWRFPDSQRWVLMAQFLGFPFDHHPQAPQDVRNVFEQNLSAYFNRFIQLQKQRTQQGQTGPLGMSNVASPGQPPSQNIDQTSQSMDPASPHRQMSPSHSLPSDINGSASHPQSTPAIETAQTRHRTASIGKVPQPSPRSVKQQTPVPEQPMLPAGSPPAKAKLEPNSETEEQPLGPIYQPKARTLHTHGGYDLGALLPAANEIARLRAPTPTLDESGPIDLHSLIMSLPSGFHFETRYALDDIVLLSRDQIQLHECEDLLDSLLEVAEDSLGVLAKAAEDSPGALHVEPFDRMCKASRLELKSLQRKPVFGEDEHPLERAADRILAVTIILRNLSFIEGNPEVMTRSDMASFVIYAVRLLGRKRLLFRSARNTVEFMKDIVVLLSNTTEFMELRSEDDASPLLHFLLSFAPAFSRGLQDTMAFTLYEPKKHQYLPCAVESLAKLLARDEPNRTSFRQIFNNEIVTSASNSLLTRAFSLAISPMPDGTKIPISKNGANLNVAVEMAKARVAFFSQGMLAADILSSLIPGADSEHAQLWLGSADGWAPNLLHLVLELANIQGRNPPARHPTTHRVTEDKGLFAIVITRALSMLSRLIEKTDGQDDSGRSSIDALLCTNEMAVKCLDIQNVSFDVWKALQSVFKLAL